MTTCIPRAVLIAEPPNRTPPPHLNCSTKSPNGVLYGVRIGQELAPNNFIRLIPTFRRSKSAISSSPITKKHHQGGWMMAVPGPCARGGRIQGGTGDASQSKTTPSFVEPPHAPISDLD